MSKLYNQSIYAATSLREESVYTEWAIPWKAVTIAIHRWKMFIDAKTAVN